MTVRAFRHSKEEFAQLGNEIYENQIRHKEIYLFAPNCLLSLYY